MTTPNWLAQVKSYDHLVVKTQTTPLKALLHAIAVDLEVSETKTIAKNTAPVAVENNPGTAGRGIS